MSVSLDDVIDLYVFSTGRRLFALLQTRAAAQRMGLADLVRRVDEALGADRETLALEARWRRQVQTGTALPEAVALDWKLDRLLSSIDTVADAAVRSEADDEEFIAQVTAFRTALFPAGVADITQRVYVDEVAEGRRIHGLLTGDHAALAAELGLARQVASLGRLLPQIEDLLATRPAGVTFDAVRAARAAGQRRLLAVAAVVLGSYPDETPAHIEARGALLGPIIAQDEEIARYLKGRRSAPDVDPETGEPVDTQAEPTDVVPPTA